MTHKRLHQSQVDCGVITKISSSLLSLTVVALIYLGTQARAEDEIPKTIGSTVPLEQVTDIKSQPLALLAKYPEAGPAMANYVAKLVTQNPSVVNAILSVVRDASAEQASAIGAGVVRAVRAFAIDRAEIARMISDKVLMSENVWLKTTYSAIGPEFDPAFFTVPPPPDLKSLNAQQHVDIGTKAPPDKGRVGPVPVSHRTPFRSRVGVNNQGGGAGQEKRKSCSYLSENLGEAACNGTIVAIVASDAPSNGAVSTSPTS